MGLFDWWKSVNDGADAAEELIDQDMGYVSDDTLYALAEQSGTPDPQTFVESCREDLDAYHKTEQIRAHGTAWQKFDAGVLIDEDKHPILKKFLPF